jgi:hypothetical protein
MGAKEFGSMLRKLIPATVNVFKKLEVGDPYHFGHWADDRSGAACMYYWKLPRCGLRSFVNALASTLDPTNRCCSTQTRGVDGSDQGRRQSTASQRRDSKRGRCERGSWSPRLQTRP